MKITLEHGQFGWDFLVRAENGKSILIQSDWEYPSFACLFGAGASDDGYESEEPSFTLKHVQTKIHLLCRPSRGRGLKQKAPIEGMKTNFGRPTLEREPELEDCEHSCTDGTIDCRDCGVTVSEFITAAHTWLSNNEGAEAEDPGYFT